MSQPTRLQLFDSGEELPSRLESRQPHLSLHIQHHHLFTSFIFVCFTFVVTVLKPDQGAKATTVLHTSARVNVLLSIPYLLNFGTF